MQQQLAKQRQSMEAQETMHEELAAEGEIERAEKRSEMQKRQRQAREEIADFRGREFAAHTNCFVPKCHETNYKLYQRPRQLCQLLRFICP